MKKRNNTLIDLRNFSEELSWLINKYGSTVFSELHKALMDIEHSSSESNQPTKASSAYLVGVLPQLFMDEDLFPTRNDMLEFANSVLKLDISRLGNRSKKEYIGHIVCEVSTSKNSSLEVVVEALDKLMGNEKEMKAIKRKKKEPNFSWADTIAKLREM